jgi:hypothetical protein
MAQQASALAHDCIHITSLGVVSSLELDIADANAPPRAHRKQDFHRFLSTKACSVELQTAAELKACMISIVLVRVSIQIGSLAELGTTTSEIALVISTGREVAYTIP